MGVAQGLLTRALAQATGVEEATLAHRLMGNWDPAHITFASLIAGTRAAMRGPIPLRWPASLKAGQRPLAQPRSGSPNGNGTASAAS